MGSPGWGWEGRWRERSGCSLAFSALASRDCSVYQGHPTHKLGLPTSPAASSHLRETSRITFPSCMGFCSLLNPGWMGPKATPREAGRLVAAQPPGTLTLGNNSQ